MDSTHGLIQFSTKETTWTKISLHVTDLGGSPRNTMKKWGTEARKKGEKMKDGVITKLSLWAAGVAWQLLGLGDGDIL